MSERDYMLYPRGDIKMKEREALLVISPRRIKEEVARGTTCYIPEET
jgi:hypothetical protein